MELDNIVAPLLGWYRENARDLPWRRNVTPYRVWISEIMLQQTRVEAVKGYFERFVSAVPEIPALAELPEQRLLKLWEGLGYYSRAKNLQRAAQVCVQRYGGRLPEDYQTLLSLPGVGPYTAGAVASIAFGLPVPAVDGNVLRVWSRLTAEDGDIADGRVKARAAEALAAVMPAGESGAFNQSLMELGATVCLPNAAPLCEKCPVKTLCEAHIAGKETQYPHKRTKPPRRVAERTLFLLEREGRLAIDRRPAKGLLASLWELPGADGTLTMDESVQAVRALGLEPLRLVPLAPYKHIFTHVEWHVSGWHVKLSPDGENKTLVWADPAELGGTYPLPSAFRPYLNTFLALSEMGNLKL
ncbi:MAG: A/G-specific adenine glycosylase [Oscillospiraceae bacterium]|jgi:A/G-specific adenine glycosylase